MVQKGGEISNGSKIDYAAYEETITGNSFTNEKTKEH